MSHETSGKPDYKGSRDEIVRMTIENRFTMKIKLRKCCNTEPKEYFQSCHDFFVVCPICGLRTKMHRHLYEAKQAWNREEVNYERGGYN